MYIDKNKIPNGFMYRYTVNENQVIDFNVIVNYDMRWDSSVDKYCHVLEIFPICKTFSNENIHITNGDYLQYILQIQFLQNNEIIEEQNKEFHYDIESLNPIKDNELWALLNNKDKSTFSFYSDSFENSSIKIRFKSFGALIQNSNINIKYLERDSLKCPQKQINFTNHTHIFQLVESIIPTCEKSGFQSYKCQCGRTKNTLMKPYGHKIVPATELRPSYCQHAQDNFCECEYKQNKFIMEDGTTIFGVLPGSSPLKKIQINEFEASKAKKTPIKMKQNLMTATPDDIKNNTIFDSNSFLNGLILGLSSKHYL